MKVLSGKPFKRRMLSSFFHFSRKDEDIMSEPDTSILETVIGDFGSSLESSVFSAITDPVVGWVGTILGLGEGSGSGVSPALAQQLSDLQSDVRTVMTQISQLETEITKYVAAIAAGEQISSAVNKVQAYQNSGAYPANGVLTVPDDFLQNATTRDLLTQVHDTLVGSTVHGAAPGPGTVAYLTTYLDTNLPRYYADYNSPSQQALLQFFVYYQSLQAVLMQMMVEAAHQGQTLNTQANPMDYSGSLPSNYVKAGQVYRQYTHQIAEQSSFLPFATSGVRYLPPGFDTGATGLGLVKIVFDRLKTTALTTEFAWGWQNVANPYNPPAFGNAQATTIPIVQKMLSDPSAWMVRVPASAELENLRASLADSQGNPVSSGTIVQSMAQLGFYVTLPAISPTTNGMPFVTNEVLQLSNWRLLNPVWLKHRPPEGTQIADGYVCDWFYDLLNGSSVTAQFNCPVLEPGFGGTYPLENVFTNIQNATSITLIPAMAGTPSGIGSATLPADAYLDALFIYQPVATDPPLEEPSSIQVGSPVQNGDGTMQFTATGSFQRFDRTARARVPATIDVSDVYWTFDDADQQLATITQGGLLTWNGPTTGSVNVIAVRGPLSSQPVPVFAPPNVQTISNLPSTVNIYPRRVRLNPSGVAQYQAFNGQVLNSDGSTNPQPDGEADNDLFTFAEANGRLSLDSPGNFMIPAGTTGSFRINLTLKSNGQLTDTATLLVQ